MRTIYAAENRMEYILEYLKERASSDSKLYKKSRDRLENLAAQCVEVLELISGILQEDALEEDELQECGPSSNYDNQQLTELARSMQATLDAINGFNAIPSDKKVPIEVPKKLVEVESVDEIEESEQISSKSTSLSPQDKKQVLKDYSKVVKSVANSPVGNRYSDKCSIIIHDWLRTRFDKDISQGFRYDIRHIPIWISDIIYAYGYYVQIGESNSFEADFYEWLDGLRLKGNNYALPYLVHDIITDEEGKYLSIAGLVIWDMLFDAGFNALEDNIVPFDESYLPDRMMRLAEYTDSNKLDGYGHYKYVPNVIERANMVYDESEENS